MKKTAKTKAKAKKRSPQDATLRNIRALKARVSRLEVLLRTYKEDLHYLANQVIGRRAYILYLLNKKKSKKCTNTKQSRKL